MSPAPSPEAPLQGGCACGAVRFAVTAPFQTAGVCHCKRCQRRSGTLSSPAAMIAADHVTILQGAPDIATWQPSDGNSKSFCRHCGGHLYARDLVPGNTVAIRLGALDDDPGVRPQWHVWTESAPGWEPLPDDGLPRFAQRRTLP